MDNKEPKLHNWREWRRFRAWDLDRRGWRHGAIAEALDVFDRAVRRWLERAHSEGPQSLRSHSAPGRPPRLTPGQRQLIPDVLWHGAEAYGFRGEIWNCVRVASVLNEEFGVAYHPSHVSRILKGLGWAPQIPITRPSSQGRRIKSWIG